MAPHSPDTPAAPRAPRGDDRVAALSRQLHQAHEDLRRRIGDTRARLGRRGPRDGTLVTHCLAFCAALTAHHRGEDDGVFPQLLRERPDLAPTIAKLVEDHGLIASILTRVTDLADTAAASPEPDLAAIGRELDGLAAIMESHFRYEERAIGAALDAVQPTIATGPSQASWSTVIV
ncbi:hemerythrin domain-containing protein [Streptomyces sp. NPDC101160]|uniref:hemerythrin domain-containing protein n=1 Tax=Streptomyces sp. NPDC101160 TaxID=3366118 RepID=UPI00382DDF10